MKPQLAEDAILELVQYPCWVQPKIDGVRALNLNGRLTGRSLDEFKGFGISEYFSQPEFVGLDGEMILGNDPKAALLCSNTTGAMGRFKDTTEMADLHWFVFDHLSPSQLQLSYEDRYRHLQILVERLGHPRIHLVPSFEAPHPDILANHIAWNASQGYEGTIIRNPRAIYKAGRATRKGQELWRVKPWGDAEILVTGVTEGARNENEAKRNSLGRTERSSAAAGLVPNGQVGSIQGILLEDYSDPINGKRLFEKGLVVTVSSGAMTTKEAGYYWENQGEIVDHIVKFKFMTHGIKDQPRFPTYLSHRLPEDMSK